MGRNIYLVWTELTFIWSRVCISILGTSCTISVQTTPLLPHAKYALGPKTYPMYPQLEAQSNDTVDSTRSILPY